MKTVSWALLVVMVLVGSGWFALLSTLWYLRHTFDIAARSPRLLFISEVAALVLTISILLNWLLLLEGRSLPCYGIFTISYFEYAFMPTPYVIRAARLVVAYSKEMRTKYARFVKSTPMMVLMVVMIIALAIRASLFFGTRPEHSSSDARDCFYFDDIRLSGLGLVFGVAPAFMLARKLSKVNDAFKIRQELEHAIGIPLIIAVVAIAIKALVFHDLLEDSRQVHVLVETLYLLIGAIMGYCGLVVPLAARFKALRSDKQNVYPVGDRSPGGSMLELDGVLDFARKGEAMGERFGEFCRENLCMESWDFIVDAVHYETFAEETDGQFSNFQRILDQYLLPSSPDEVNISSTMRKKILSYKTRDDFGSLDESKRRDIFKDPLDDVVRMLEQNLLTKFRQRELQQPDVQQAGTVKRGKGLMTLMSFSS